MCLNPRNPRQILTGKSNRNTAGSALLYFSDDDGATFINWDNGLPNAVDHVTFAADWLFFAFAGDADYRYDERSGDLDNTNRVDGGDLAILSLAFGSLEGEDNYNSAADLNSDGAVDGADLAIISSIWGHRFYYEDEPPPGDFRN